MQKESLRTCSIKIGAECTNLIEVDRESFDRFVGEYKTESVKTIIELYKTCSFFSLLSDTKKVELSAKSFMIKYPTNTVIIKQGDPAFNIFFVASGKVSLLRRVKSANDEPKDA